MSAKLPPGWTVRRIVDEDGERLEILPPELTSAAEGELIEMALNKFTAEYLEGVRTWEDFPPEFRPWLCVLYHGVWDEFVAVSKKHSKNRMAERATDIILELVRSGADLAHLDERLASDDPEKQKEGARTVAAKQFKVKRDSLRRTHTRGHRGKKG